MFTDVEYSNPFPGLRAFEEQEDILFFGREKQIDELLRKLRTARLLAVIGSSGSGKSSLVKSGLIPALYSGFMAGTSSTWHICTFRPGSDPIGNMAEAISQDGVLHNYTTEDEQHTHTAINESILRRSSFGLVEAYRQSGTDVKTNLLIIVDQFEELFRFSRYEKESREGKRDSVAFINLLLKAVEHKELPIYIVFTMRSDFLGDCTEFRGLPEAINDGQYLVPRMTREERRDAIAGPVAVGGAELSPALLNLLLNDIGDNPDQLPIMQHAMMRTWDIWKKKNPEQNTPLEIADYEDAGTMASALSQHAEEAYNELEGPGQKQLCEAIFKALTDRGTDARGLRRPQKVSELASLSGTTEAAVIDVIEVFRKKGRAFLMPPENVPLLAASIIDISHESLMRVWSRLIGWVEEEGQAGQIYLRLCEAAAQYELGKGGLWRDPELQIALKWKEDNMPNETWASRYNLLFDKAMLFLNHSKHQYELQRRYKERMQRMRLKRARRTVITISCIAGLAFLLAIYSLNLKNIATSQTKIAEKKSKEALYQQGIAVKQEQIAEQQRKAAELQKLLADSSAVVALQQKEFAEQEKIKATMSEYLAVQQGAIARAQKLIAEDNAAIAKREQERAEIQTQRAISGEATANEQSQITARLKNLAEARNLANHSILLLNESRYDESRKEALSAYALNAANNGPMQSNEIYNALDRNWSNGLHNSNQSLLHRYPVRSVAVMPGNNVLSADESGMVRYYSNAGGTLSKRFEFNIGESLRSLTVSPDGSRVVVVTFAGNALLFRIGAGAATALSKLHFNGIGKSCVFVNDTLCLVGTSEGVGCYSAAGSLKELSFTNTKSIAAICTSGGKVFIANGERIDRYNRWVDIGRRAEQTFNVIGTVTSLGIDNTGQYLAAGTAEGSLWLHNATNNVVKTQPLHVSSITDLKFVNLSNGRLQLATASADNTIKLLDVNAVFNKSEESIVTLRGHNKWIYTLAPSRDGQYLYSGGEDKKVITWKTTMAGLYQDINNQPQ